MKNPFGSCKLYLNNGLPLSIMENSMNEKQLRKLRRTDLLDLLVSQAQEIERLEAEVESLKSALNDKDIKIAKAGSIAEAALELNGIFEAAQKAADQYLANIQQLKK